MNTNISIDDKAGSIPQRMTMDGALEHTNLQRNTSYALLPYAQPDDTPKAPRMIFLPEDYAKNESVVQPTYDS